MYVCVGGSKTTKSDGFIVVNLFYRAVLSQSVPVFNGINNYYMENWEAKTYWGGPNANSYGNLLHL